MKNSFALRRQNSGDEAVGQGEELLSLLSPQLIAVIVLSPKVMLTV